MAMKPTPFFYILLFGLLLVGNMVALWSFAKPCAEQVTVQEEQLTIEMDSVTVLPVIKMKTVAQQEVMFSNQTAALDQTIKNALQQFINANQSHLKNPNGTLQIIGKANPQQMEATCEKGLVIERTIAVKAHLQAQVRIANQVELLFSDEEVPEDGKDRVAIVLIIPTEQG